MVWKSYANQTVKLKWEKTGLVTVQLCWGLKPFVKHSPALPITPSQSGRDLFLYCVEFESKVWFSKPRKAAALWRRVTNSTVSVGGTAGIVHVYKHLFGAQQ